MQLVQKVSIKAAIPKRVPLVTTAMLDSTRIVLPKIIVTIVLQDSIRTKLDSHRARHVAKESTLQVHSQPNVKTVMQANIRTRRWPPHIPARSVRQGNLLSTHNPLAPTVPLENTRHQVVQQVRRARTVPPDTHL